MLDRLPVFIDPLKLSERRKNLSGSIDACNLKRLSDILVDDSRTIEIDFSFEKEGKLSFLLGTIKAKLVLQCQACLNELVWPVDMDIKLGFVSSLEQADKLIGDCEPLILEDERVSLNQLVEDELLLALPDFPRHENECYKKINSVSSLNNNEQTGSNNPFSVLAKIKSTGD